MKVYMYKLEFSVTDMLERIKIADTSDISDTVIKLANTTKGDEYILGRHLYFNNAHKKYVGLILKGDCNPTDITQDNLIGITFQSTIESVKKELINQNSDNKDCCIVEVYMPYNYFKDILTDTIKIFQEILKLPDEQSTSKEIIKYLNIHFQKNPSHPILRNILVNLTALAILIHGTKDESEEKMNKMDLVDTINAKIWEAILNEAKLASSGCVLSEIIDIKHLAADNLGKFGINKAKSSQKYEPPVQTDTQTSNQSRTAPTKKVT